jgi:RNA polymerase sigma factor (sigma-70 family)
MHGPNLRHRFGQRIDGSFVCTEVMDETRLVAPAESDAAVDGVEPAADQTPLEAVFRSHYGRLVGLARVLLDRTEEAEEVVQEAFARVLARRGDRRGRSSVTVVYVERAVVNLCRDGLRRRAVIRRVPPPRPIEGRGADAVVLGSTEQRQVVDAVRALPRRQRECVALRHLLGRSTTETAELLGIGEGSVKTHLHRGMAALETALEDWR